MNDDTMLRTLYGIDIEQLSSRLHDIYQKQANASDVVRHSDNYEELSEHTKEYDRVLARWIVTHWSPQFNISEGLPPA